MGFNFQNNTNSTVYIAFAYPNSGCGPVNYAKIGWYQVLPGQRRSVWSGYAGGQTFYYYAEDAFGRRWDGPYFTDLPQQAFHWCWNTGCTTCRNLGMRRVYVPIYYADFTLNLVSVSSRVGAKVTSGNVRYALPSKPGVANTKASKIPTSIPRKRVKGKPFTGNRVSLPAKVKRKK